MNRPDLLPSYDITLRNIFAIGGSKFLRDVGAGGCTRLDTDVSRISKRAVDFLGYTSDRRLVHIEFQRAVDKRMPIRLLDYHGAILAVLTQSNADWASYQLHQVLFHVANDSRLHGRQTYVSTNLRLDYVAVDSRRVYARDLVDGGDVGDAILSVICEGGKDRGLVKDVLGKIRSDTGNRFSELVGQYLTLSHAVRAAEIISEGIIDMGWTIDARELPYVQQALAEQAKSIAVQYFLKECSISHPEVRITPDMVAQLSRMPVGTIEALTEAARHKSPHDLLDNGVPGYAGM
jgi:hypothetical protein